MAKKKNITLEENISVENISVENHSNNKLENLEKTFSEQFNYKYEKKNDEMENSKTDNTDVIDNNKNTEISDVANVNEHEAKINIVNNVVSDYTEETTEQPINKIPTQHKKKTTWEEMFGYIWNGQTFD